VFHVALHYFVSREITVANAMRRQFNWKDKVLKAEDIHCPAVVGLASDDVLLCAPAIKRYLGERAHMPLELLWWEGSLHGEFLLSASKQGDIDRIVREQEAKYVRSGHRRRREPELVTMIPNTTSDTGIRKTEPW
jgi:hypothetical protein